VPDLVVFPDSLTTVEQTAVQALYREANTLERAIFNYAVRFIQERSGLQPSFELSAADMDAFIAALPEAGVHTDPSVAREAERFLRYRLTREIAAQSWGDAAEFDKARGYDTQLRRALDVLSRASTTDALFREAARAGGNRITRAATEPTPGG
jgi:hypothetical protein